MKLLHKKSNLFHHYKNLNKIWFIKFTDILYGLKKEHKKLNFHQNQNNLHLTEHLLGGTVEQPSGKVLSGGTYTHRNKEHDMLYFFL